MSTKSRQIPPLAIAAATLTGGALSLAYLLRRRFHNSLPREGSLRLPGLAYEVEIVRDRWGVSHIFARGETDLFFTQGYVHAQDRLFQMDVQRRVGLGRLSEVVGPAGLSNDRFARVLGWHRAAAAQLDALEDDETSHALLAAYAAGVNAFLAHETLPPEFAILAYRPEPWQPLHSMAWGAVLAWGLSVNWESELTRAALIASLGAEKARDLMPATAADYTTILGATDLGTRLPEALLAAYREALASLPLGAVPAGHGVGSNNWVIAGERTRSGRPLLANDPHLPVIFPPFWHEIHLQGGRYHLAGFSAPGIPGLIVGHNERVAWGVTNAFPDVQDLYVERFHPEQEALYEVDGQWEPAHVTTEVIRVRGRRPHVETVYTTRHGPIISDLVPGEKRRLALRWSYHDRNHQIRATLAMALAHDGATFKEALRDWAFPSQNFVYADIKGNIGYVMPGRVPRRGRGEGIVPSPGWDTAYDWIGWIPFDELPSVVNPPRGFVVTANNQVTGDNYPHLLNSEWLPPYRAQRISDLIVALSPLDVNRCRRIQTDTVSLLLTRFVRAALQKTAAGALSASRQEDHLQRLDLWDGDMDAAAVAPSLAHGWLTNFTSAVVTQAVGIELAEQLLGPSHTPDVSSNPFHDLVHELVTQWLEQGTPEWVGEITSLLAPALEQTVATLTQMLGPDVDQWQWGRLHYVKFEHPLARIPMLGRLWRPVSYPLGGDGYTVNQAEVGPGFPPPPVAIIPSCRMILDVGAWDNSISALPGGQSGLAASEHFQDGIEDWVEGRYHPMLFSRSRIEAEARARLRLLPASSAQND